MRFKDTGGQSSERLIKNGALKSTHTLQQSAQFIMNKLITILVILGILEVKKQISKNN